MRYILSHHINVQEVAANEQVEVNFLLRSNVFVARLLFLLQDVARWDAIVADINPGRAESKTLVEQDVKVVSIAPLQNR